MPDENEASEGSSGRTSRACLHPYRTVLTACNRGTAVSYRCVRFVKFQEKCAVVYMPRNQSLVVLRRTKIPQSSTGRESACTQIICARFITCPTDLGSDNRSRSNSSFPERHLMAKEHRSRTSCSSVGRTFRNTSRQPFKGLFGDLGRSCFDYA